MIAKDCGRTMGRALIAAAALVGLGTQAAWAQKGRGAPASTGKLEADPGLAPVLTPGVKILKKELPANPNDAVAIINGQAITRRQLADECVARRGKEILDTLVARTLIEQALVANKMEVTAAEVDAGIDQDSMRFAGLGREAWLRSLEKERGISPVQYARDIVYPRVAMRKLAGPQVQVTAKDLQEAFDAQFGEKLRVRVIMSDKLRDAQEIWEELKKNPGGFEKLAQERSVDQTTRSLGGLIGQPITRHAQPQTFSDAVFLRLIGDPNDKDPAHKPKDGDFTGPIQYSEGIWAIVRREGLVPAQKVDPQDPKIRALLHEMMFEAKVSAKMGEVYQELFRAAKIENLYTGQTKVADEEQKYGEHRADGQVKLMGHEKDAAVTPAGISDGSPRAALPSGPPAGVSTEAAARIGAVKKKLQTSAIQQPMP